MSESESAAPAEAPLANSVARPGRVPITDARVLGAFAHPLRLCLLHHLMRTGPDTASRCAEAVDDSDSNCSYRLRLLHRYGLVERVEAEDGADARDRGVAIVGAELSGLTRRVRYFLAASACSKSRGSGRRCSTPPHTPARRTNSST
ncbi:winged helix-turn-helix domain-containing protein [Streptomyces sp. NPDC001351]|uniref:winged helix-turn-helix domain-containing protein n=1 Tax=Streptomyces sp. NPDC001351 TaxID=3364564 RepID=UPI00368A6513